MGNSLPWTLKNRRAKCDAASFILGREIRNRTNTHRHTKQVCLSSGTAVYPHMPILHSHAAWFHKRRISSVAYGPRAHWIINRTSLWYIPPILWTSFAHWPIRPGLPPRTFAWTVSSEQLGFWFYFFYYFSFLGRALD